MLFFRLTLVPIQEGKMRVISYVEEKVDEFPEALDYYKLCYVKIVMVSLCPGQLG